MACTQAGELEEHNNIKEQGKGIKALAMVQHKGEDKGKIIMHCGKVLVCLNLKCRGNYYLRDCPKASDQEKVKILAMAREKCRAEGVA